MNDTVQQWKYQITFCIFESHATNILFRHTEPSSLAVRMVKIVGKYYYIINWEFKQSRFINLIWAIISPILISTTSIFYMEIFLTSNFD